MILDLAVKGRLLPIAQKGDSNTPVGWHTCRLGSILAFEYGNNLPAAKRSNTGEYPVYGSNGIVGSHHECFVKEPCIVIGRKGSAGALNLSLGSGCCVTDVAYYCIPPKALSLEFTFKLLHTLRLDALGKGIKPGLSRKEAYALQMLVPPLEEQHRIVAKVDELMALCDTLESQQANAESAHAQLVQVLLDGLTQVSDADDFAVSWQRLAEHFDTVFTTEASIDALKQTLLHLAVMGKLVSQDSTDEPASALLRLISEEKTRLISEEGLRTTASDDIPEAERYFAQHAGWASCRLGNLARFIDYRGRTPTKTTSGIPLITAKNVRPGFISKEPQEFIAENDYVAWMTRGFPRAGDMLFTTEAPMGNVAIIDIAEKFALAQRVICFQLHELGIGQFLRLVMMSTDFHAQLSDAATGMTATGIKSSRLKEIPVPIPPLAEQHRIVAKVDQLMTLCDQLKFRIRQARDLNQQLASTLVERAVA